MILQRKPVSLIVLLTLTLGAACAQTAGVDPALLAKANGGDTEAQVALGDKYAAGEGVVQNYKLAAEWYRKAAEAGNVPGEIHLADGYRDGRGLTRDMAQAAAWYRKAADQGDAAPGRCSRARNAGDALHPGTRCPAK